jgi:N12 class adenine-specific DNA methylase
LLIDVACIELFYYFYLKSKIMGANPAVRIQVEKEWNKIASVVGERIGVATKNANTTQLLEEIKSKEEEVYNTMHEYLKAYENYVNYIKDVDEGTVRYYFELEDRMNEKKEHLFSRLSLHK